MGKCPSSSTAPVACRIDFQCSVCENKFSQVNLLWLNELDFPNASFYSDTKKFAMVEDTQKSLPKFDYFTQFWQLIDIALWNPIFLQVHGERKNYQMMNPMKVLKLLVKTYANWCATLNSTVLRNKVRNIIDNNDDNDTVTKTTAQPAWAGVWFSKRLSCMRAASLYDGERKYFFALLRAHVLSNAEPAGIA